MKDKYEEEQDEDFFSEEDDEEFLDDEDISVPFDPSEINIASKPMSLQTLIERIKHKEIILNPEFQRGEVWKLQAKSRLIESILLKIPLPAFYMDATDEDKWLVIDGQQRLSTIRDFVLGNKEGEYLALKGLEYLKQFDGIQYKNIPRKLQRRLKETQVTLYLIEEGTPDFVKFNIFRRINTGGLPLSLQEIRHALYQGPVTQLLAELSEDTSFLSATLKGLKSKRMENRECILRFFAFRLHSATNYSYSEFNNFLSDVMMEINEMQPAERTLLVQEFQTSMRRAMKLFGENAFRKAVRGGKRRYPISKALFEVWSVVLAEISEKDFNKFASHRNVFLKNYINLLEDPQYWDAVSSSTGVRRKVRRRFSGALDMLQQLREEIQ